MTVSGNGRYRIVRLKRGQPHTVYLGRESGQAEEWILSATVSTKDDQLARDLERCRRDRGLLDLGQTDEGSPNHVKLDRITTALRHWQQGHGRGNRALRPGSQVRRWQLAGSVKSGQ